MSTPPMFNRIVVGIIATVAGAWMVKETGKDFQFVTFTPFSEDEVQRRKEQKIGMSMRSSDQLTLDYTPEAKDKIRRKLEKDGD